MESGGAQSQKKVTFAGVKMTGPKVRDRQNLEHFFTKRGPKRKYSIPIVLQQKSRLERPQDKFIPCVRGYSVDINIVKDLFEEEAWNALRDSISIKIGRNEHECCICKELDDGQLKMIECEGLPRLVSF